MVDNIEMDQTPTFDVCYTSGYIGQYIDLQVAKVEKSKIKINVIPLLGMRY